MRARVGDRLVPDGDSDRVGVVIGLRNADGSPPYVIKWLSGGHIALVYPGPYARVIPGDGSPGSTADSTADSTARAGRHEAPADGAAQPNGTA
jgi:hypothetical protein